MCLSRPWQRTRARHRWRKTKFELEKCSTRPDTVIKPATIARWRFPENARDAAPSAGAPALLCGPGRLQNRLDRRHVARAAPCRSPRRHTRAGLSQAHRCAVLLLGTPSTDPPETCPSRATWRYSASACSSRRPLGPLRPTISRHQTLARVRSERRSARLGPSLGFRIRCCAFTENSVYSSILLRSLASLCGIVAFAVDRRNLRTHRPQIHRQLPAMVNRVM